MPYNFIIKLSESQSVRCYSRLKMQRMIILRTVFCFAALKKKAGKRSPCFHASGKNVNDV